MSLNHEQRGVSGSRRAFTLIEVLVVVAIIAMLIAILMPSLAAARNQARSAACISNLKQCVTGVQMSLLEGGMRRERVSTNFGWATPSFKNNKEARGIFTCPADTNPLPMPPLYADVSDGATYHGRTASDGVFNHVWPPNIGPPALLPHGEYYLDIQDTVDQTGFGRDAASGDYDLLLKYSAEPGATSASISVKDVESGWSFKVLNHKGETVWPDAKGAGGSAYLAPLLWMSYGANAAAGLRNTKGNPILLVENSKPGVFPESYAGKGSQGGGEPNDDLKKTLRFRHGPMLSRKGYGDGTYVVRQKLNGAFLDGHVEGLSYSRILSTDPAAPQVDPATGSLLWHRDIWLGIRRTGDFSFD